MYDVFISYSSEDQEQADLVCKLLKDNGITYWYSPEHMRGAQDFTEEIPKALNMSKAFLLLMSKSAQSSGWVKDEVVQAKSRKNFPIYVLFLEDCDLNYSYGFVLGRTQHFKYSLGFEEQMRRFISDITDDSIKPRIDLPPNAKVYSTKQASKKKWLIGSLCVLAVAALVAVLLVLNSDSDGDYVIWNPEFNVALSVESVNDHYHAGEQVITQGDKLAGYGNKCVWELEFYSDNTFTISYNGAALGVESGYNGIGLGGNYTSNKWELMDAGYGTYFIRNVESGKYLEWYVEKNNWTTHDVITEENRSRYILRVEKAS